jgi:hypothetical protein
MIAPVWSHAIRLAVEEAKPYSFGDPQRITEWAELFVEAHQAAPGGLSIEIGSWRGGTALVFLRLLERLYPAETRPMLFTVDPYGDKPYDGGDGPAKPALYGDADYVVMKKLLARFPHHAHFYMTSAAFFVRPATYWWLGLEQQVERVSFALVDGEHDAWSIRDDVHDVGLVMAPDGIIVVDNIDNDPRTDTVLGDVATQQLRVCEPRVGKLRRLDGALQRYAVLRPLSVEAACR